MFVRPGLAMVLKILPDILKLNDEGFKLIVSFKFDIYKIRIDSAKISITIIIKNNILLLSKNLLGLNILIYMSK